MRPNSIPLPGRLNLFRSWTGIACAVWALAGTGAGAGGEIDKAILDLGHADFTRRQKACDRLLSLGLLDPEGVRAALREDHDDPEVAHASRLLKMRLFWEPFYRKVVGNGEDPELYEALKAVYMIPSVATWKRFYEAAGEHLPVFAPFLDRAIVEPDTEFRKCLLTYVTLRHPCMAERLVPLLDDKDPVVRAAAVTMFGANYLQDHADRIVQALQDGDMEVRVKAIEVFRLYGGKAYAPQVAAVLDDCCTQVNVAALNALRDLRAKEFAPRIARLLGDSPVYQVRFAAVGALRILKDPGTIPALVGALDDQVDIVRYAAAEAIGKVMGDEWTRQHFIEGADAVEEEAGPPTAADRHAWWKAHEEKNERQVAAARAWWEVEKTKNPRQEAE